jgi:uncharacterized alkaline shock family protein YloU
VTGPAGSVAGDSGGRLDTASGGSPDAGARGRTTIADRVVEKIAAITAGEVDRASGTPRRLLGTRFSRPSASTRPRASAKVDETTVSLKLSVSVEYPAPVRDVAAEVRERVARRIYELTGLKVTEIDITVPLFLTERPRPPRVR